MWKVDIYLENAGKSVKRKKGWYGYVLAYQGQRFHTLAAIGKLDAEAHSHLERSNPGRRL